MTMQNTLHIEEEAAEKICLKCKEPWPATDQFFGRLPNGRLHGPCKACVDDRRREMAATTPCCVPGCTNPRYHWRYARCWEHRLYLAVNPNPRTYRKRAQS